METQHYRRSAAMFLLDFLVVMLNGEVNQVEMGLFWRFIGAFGGARLCLMELLHFCLHSFSLFLLSLLSFFLTWAHPSIPSLEKERNQSQSGTCSAFRASPAPGQIERVGEWRASSSSFVDACLFCGESTWPERLPRPSCCADPLFFFLFTDERQWRQSRGESCVSLCRLQRC